MFLLYAKVLFKFQKLLQNTVVSKKMPQAVLLVQALRISLHLRNCFRALK